MATPSRKPRARKPARRKTPRDATEEWLAIPGQKPLSKARPRPPAKRKPAKKEAAKPAGPATRSQRSRELSTRLKTLEAAQAKQAEQMKELTRELRSVRKAMDQVAARLEPRRAERPRAPAARTGDWQAEKPASTLDLNKIDIDQLQALGLSIGESVRLVAVREVHGEFSSLDELDEIDGLSAEAVALLKKRLRV